MANGGGIAKKTVAPADDSVDAATVARWLNCSPRMVRQYAEEGLVIRTGPGRFDLERSVGNVVLHLRELASSRRGADGTDVVKASAALKDAQRKLAELRYAQLDAQVISLPEAEMLWADLVRSARRLFQCFPARARATLPHLSDADQATLEKVGEAMLREIALKGQVPLPAAESDAELDAE
jgi:phage terminase Nu1 subunit (DNA packaging protein)